MEKNIKLSIESLLSSYHVIISFISPYQENERACNYYHPPLLLLFVHLTRDSFPLSFVGRYIRTSRTTRKI